MESSLGVLTAQKPHMECTAPGPPCASPTSLRSLQIQTPLLLSQSPDPQAHPGSPYGDP